MVMTTKNLLKELVAGKELICNNATRGNGKAEPIYVKIDKYGSLTFTYEGSSYGMETFGLLFPQLYPFTRITAKDWQVAEEVTEKQWYELLPVARVDSDGYAIFTKTILCTARPNFVGGLGDKDYLRLVTGYKWFNNKTTVKFCTQSETVIPSTGIFPVNDMQLSNHLSNFNLGTSNV
jgi:hypothetical protein